MPPGETTQGSSFVLASESGEQSLLDRNAQQVLMGVSLLPVFRPYPLMVCIHALAKVIHGHDVTYAITRSHKVFGMLEPL